LRRAYVHALLGSQPAFNQAATATIMGPGKTKKGLFAVLFFVHPTAITTNIRDVARDSCEINTIGY